MEAPLTGCSTSCAQSKGKRLGERLVAITHDDFAWQAPVNLGGVVTAATDAGPSLFESDDTGVPQLFSASNRLVGPGLFDIYVSTMNGAGLGPPTLLQELSSLVDLTPASRHDGTRKSSSLPTLRETPGFPFPGLWVAIERGSVVIRNGRIESVTEGAAGTQGIQTIDAGGMTAMPGFIDGHRHIMRGDAEQWLQQEAAARMQEFLEAGLRR